VEQFERIRRDHRDEGLSIKALAGRHGVHRRTVREALADAVPPARKTPVRTAPVLGPHEATVRRWLSEDMAAPRKQRHTGRRVWQRLVEEEGVEVAESSVRALVRELKVELGADRRQVAVPQTHGPAEEAEVDFGEFQAVIAGTLMKLFMFVLRLSHSGKAAHVAYANQAQESFLDGHVRAFDTFGGVPTGMIRYDNLTPAVIRVALGRERLENPRFVALRSHYGYDSFFCLRPGPRPTDRAVQTCITELWAFLDSLVIESVAMFGPLRRPLSPARERFFPVADTDDGLITHFGESCIDMSTCVSGFTIRRDGSTFTRTVTPVGSCHRRSTPRSIATTGWDQDPLFEKK